MDRNIKYHGLRERPNYEDIVNYLATEKPKKDYPDRKATILRNSPYMTMLDGENGMDLTDFENRLEKDKLREILIRENSRSTGESLAASRASASVGRDTPPLHPASDSDEGVAGEMQDHNDMIAAYRAREDSRHAAMGGLGDEAVGSLHGPRDAAASALEAARGALGGLYERFRGPRTADEAGAADPPIEGRRHHERVGGPTTRFKGKFSL